MTETEAKPFPLHPDWEAALAADPGRTYLWDLTRPVRSATEAEVAEYGRRHTDPEWWWLYRQAGSTGHVAEPAPVAEPVPAENDGLTLTESGHTDPAAASEGDAAAPETHNERCCMTGIAPGSGPHPDCPGVETLAAFGGVLLPADLPGGPTVSEAEGAEPVNAPAGQPDQGRTPTDVEAGLITQQQKDLSSDQGLDWHSPDQATVTDCAGEATS